MKPIYSPNYTQLPNAILDNLPDFSDAELRVLLCICRQTFGWHRESFKASVSFIAKGVGMSEQGVRNAVESLTKSGVLGREKNGMSYSYTVAALPSDPSTLLTSTLNAVDLNPSTPLTSLPLNPSTPLREINKGTETKVKSSAGVPPAPFSLEHPVAAPKAETSPSRKFSDAWCAAFKERFGTPYLYTTADGVQASRLLKVVTPEQIIAAAKEAWRQTDASVCWACVHQSSSVAKFVGAWANITAELKRARERKAAASQMRVPKGNY